MLRRAELQGAGPFCFKARCTLPLKQFQVRVKGQVQQGHPSGHGKGHTAVTGERKWMMLYDRAGAVAEAPDLPRRPQSEGVLPQQAEKARVSAAQTV